MIDLNDYSEPVERHDLPAIRERLRSTIEFWIFDFFPNLRVQPDRKAGRLADFSGRPPSGEGSCIIHLRGARAGQAYDFATGESAGPIDLIKYATGLTGQPLFDEAARVAGLDRPVSRQPARAAPAKDHTAEIERILEGCEPMAGTLGAHYLSTRGLEDPECADLLFHPDLADFQTKRGYCAIVAVVRDFDGSRVGGIHRTYLEDDGTGKAAPGKKMLGDCIGGAVQLYPMTDGGHVGIAEGIETAIAARQIFDVPCWAALSREGLRQWRWPGNAHKVTIFSDAGEPGEKAARELGERLAEEGRDYEIVMPIYGDDFNDDLQRGATLDEYRKKPPAQPFSDVAMIETRIAELTREAEYETLKDVIGSVVQASLEPLAEERLLTKLKSRIGGNLSTLRDQVKLLKRRLNATGDISRAPVKPAWDGMLIKDLLGKPERNEANVITALFNDPEFAGVLTFDEFRLEVIVAKPLPWDPDLRDCRPWNDADDVRCAEWLQRREINVAPSTVSRSVQGVARQNTRHPVREYLHGLEWDGHLRLERFAVDYLGAADTPLNAKFGALWIISAVARIMKPGCKADHMLILEGPQGARKSTAINTLVGDAWFTDDLEDVSSKDAKQQLRGAWVIEIAELDAIGRAEVSKIKAFLSRKVDRYRPPYGRYVMDVPRQCVFAGSVNPETYLRDETGNRRFWPIVCGEIDIAAIERDRDQLWAEAITRYEGGAVWWLTDPELIASSRKEQEARFQSDAWDDQIESWLHYDGDLRRLEPIDDVSIGEILQHVIRVEVAKWTRADQMRVSSYLKRNGWERYRVGGGDRSWRYKRVPTS